MFAFCFLMLSESLPPERAVCIGIVSRSVEEPIAFYWTQNAIFFTTDDCGSLHPFSEPVSTTHHAFLFATDDCEPCLLSVS